MDRRTQMQKMLADPKYKDIISTPEFQAAYAALNEDKRQELVERRLRCRKELNVSYQEGIEFLNGIWDTIKFIKDNVEYFEEENGDRLRVVEFKNLASIESIEIRLLSKATDGRKRSRTDF